MEQNKMVDLLNKTSRKEKLIFRKNEALFHEGDDANGIYVMNSGNAKLVKRTSPESNLILHIADSGTLLGLHAVINMHKHTYSAIALSRIFTYLIPRDEFLRIVNENANLKLVVMRMLCSSIDLIESKINTRNEKSASERLADTLVSLIKTYGTDSEGCLNLDLYLNDLASLIGASPDYLNKKMLEFKKSGLISDKSGKIQVLDFARLEKIARLRRAVPA